MSEPAAAFSSGTAIFAFDEDLEVVCWNDAAAKLTGISADEAVGRRCWEVVGGVDDAGGIVCHNGCARARHVREGRCVGATEFHARTRDGRRRLSFETITTTAEGRRLFLHVMRDAPAPAEPPPEGPPPQLTPRQREILSLLADGLPVKTVAHRLGLMETTVRNHIRLLFVALGAHSQLEAVARARAHRLV